MNTQEFLQKMKAKCEVKASEMASLELSIWNDQHEISLKADFGFNDQTVSDRKKQLISLSKNNRHETV